MCRRPPRSDADGDLGLAGMVKELTADVAAGVEGLGDLGIHLDEHLPPLGQLLVARGDLLPHPLEEGFADYTINDIKQPLARDLVDVPVVHEVGLHLGVLAAVLEDPLDGERLVEGSVAEFDVVALDPAAGVK